MYMPWIDIINDCNLDVFVDCEDEKLIDCITKLNECVTK